MFSEKKGEDEVQPELESTVTKKGHFLSARWSKKPSPFPNPPHTSTNSLQAIIFFVLCPFSFTKEEREKLLSRKTFMSTFLDLRIFFWLKKKKKQLIHLSCKSCKGKFFQQKSIFLKIFLERNFL